jgi:predicted ATPase
MNLLEPALTWDDGAEVLPIYMDLAARAGDRGLAIAAFERVSTRLQNDLGVEPPARVREVARRLASDVDAPSAETPRSEVVGRATELGDITGLLARPECRLLTLFGPGGIGKSTVAELVLDRMTGRYPDGGTIVSLEPVRDPDDVPAAIASHLAISLDGRADTVEQIIGVLRNRRMLLVLDNVEHLGPAWTIFSRLLDACSGVDIVTTSRERLRLEREWLYEVAGLPEGDAVALFRSIGQRVAPGVAVSVAQAQAICRAVGGSPLGIELAAPWLRVIPPDEIISEIQRNVDVLSGGYRDGPERHRSVAAMMKQSWDLASDRERVAIEALSVFAAPYTRELAEEVAGVSAPRLRDLLDQSLVHRRTDGLYASHPLVRGYAATHLAADDQRRREVQRRHARTMLELVAATDASDRQTALEDVIAAWDHAVEIGAVDLITPAVEGVTSLMVSGGRIHRGLQMLADAAALVARNMSEGAVQLGVIRHAESRLLYLQGRHEQAAAAAEEASQAAVDASDRRLNIRATLALGWALKWTEGDQRQYQTISQALPLAEGLGDPDLIAEVLNGLGCSASTLEQCSLHLERGLSVVGPESNEVRARLLHNLGMVLWALGEEDRATDHVQAALAIARSAGDRSPIVENLSSLAFIQADLGDLASAQQLSHEAESLTGVSEFPKARIYVRLIAGEIRRLVGEPDEAQRLADEAMTMALSVGNEPYTLRALRLHGQLLVDRGQVDAGLGVLAYLLSKPSHKGGDFTSEVLNPRAWTEATRDVDDVRVAAARKWAAARTLEQVIADTVS